MPAVYPCRQFSRISVVVSRTAPAKRVARWGFRGYRRAVKMMAMKHTFIIAVLLAAVLSGSVLSGSLLAADSGANAADESAAGVAEKNYFDRAGELVIHALSMIGVKYKWGGNDLEGGLDCSGLVGRVFNEVTGLVLPRDSRSMSKVGTSVEKAELKPGDLVFFNTLRRPFSHVGIYIGNDRFVHSPRRGREVEVSELRDGYWKKRFNGARRLLP